jgi:O-antigen ligase
MLISWTRTAFVGLLIAAVMFGLWMLWQQWRPRFRYRRSIATLSTIGIIASLTIGSAIYASTLKPADYALETSTQLFSEEAYAGARTFALYRSYDNFVQKPFTGIGFGVPSDPRLLDPAFAQETGERIKMGLGSEVLPDKGNAYLGALEESGVLGGTLWLGLFAYLLAMAVKSGPVGLAVGTYLTISNLAEATLFSLGGIGMTLWIGMIVAMTVKGTDLKLSLDWLRLGGQS